MSAIHRLLWRNDTGGSADRHHTSNTWRHKFGHAHIPLYHSIYYSTCL